MLALKRVESFQEVFTQRPAQIGIVDDWIVFYEHEIRSIAANKPSEMRRQNAPTILFVCGTVLSRERLTRCAATEGYRSVAARIDVRRQSARARLCGVCDEKTCFGKLS
jgi:hypothetical protein